MNVSQHIKNKYGFKVVNMMYKENSKAEHTLLMKQHNINKCSEKPPDRTLFILGVPPFVTEDLFSAMFSQFGQISNVYFHSKPDVGLPPKNVSKYFTVYPEIKGYKVAYVVFKNEIGVERALGMEDDEKLVLMNDGDESPFGIKKWCHEYNKKLINPVEIMDEINSYMAEYDKKIEEEEKRLKDLTNKPDDEGWLTVTRKGRNPGISRKESVQKNIKKKESLKKKKKQLVNFYRFQIKESKMNHLLKLREKFEEDKKKIEILKQSRKFKPF